MIFSENRFPSPIAVEDMLFGIMRLVLLDPDHLRHARDHPIAPHRRKSLAHGVLSCRIGNKDNGDGTGLGVAVGAPMVALHNGFQRNFLFGKPRGDGGRGSRLVAREQPDVVCLLYTSPSPRARTRSRMP